MSIKSNTKLMCTISSGFKMEDLSVTVCMAAYNGEKYLREQIDSVLSELAGTDELVVVDDCSSDATYKLLLSYSAKDPRVKVFKNAYNSGVVKTFETALSYAQNDIVFLADQDDIWMPGRVDTCLAIFKSKPEVSAVLVNAEILAFQEKTGLSFYPAGLEPKLTITSQLLRNQFIGCCLCFRRSMLKIALPFPTSISMHDWWLGCCTLLSGSVCFVNESKIYYRRHSTNASPSQRRALSVVLKSRAADVLCFFKLLARFLDKRLERVK
ncbi:glycosyltransferase [Pseudomonas sp. FSL R10-1350]|nr:glycosyltransferase [Pseudomonas sp. FSL R10-0399]MQU62767.1 glycosyltransferase [Pseudomonas sp. FSL R10-1350]